MAAAAVPPGAIIAATGAIMALGTLPYIVCKNASGNGAIYVNIAPTGGSLTVWLLVPLAVAIVVIVMSSVTLARRLNN